MSTNRMDVFELRREVVARLIAFTGKMTNTDNLGTCPSA